jgi:hypothetical protein
MLGISAVEATILSFIRDRLLSLFYSSDLFPVNYNEVDAGDTSALFSSNIINCYYFNYSSVAEETP